MSGERRSRTAGMILLILLCFILALAIGVGGEEAEGEDVLLRQINVIGDTNGSWGNGLTTMRVSSANSVDEIETYSYLDDEDDSNADLSVAYKSADHWVSFYDGTQSIEEKMEFTISVKNQGSYLDVGYFKFATVNVTADLVSTQQPEGSWNKDVGDTALASHALIITEDDSDASDKGIEWLQEYEDPKTHSWGSIDDDSKAILALDSAGYDMWEELAALMLKQRPDGSFGGIEETSWAVIALSTNYNEETAKSMERAVAWLRDQEYDNNQDLALAALAEQYYEDAKFREEQEAGSGGASGFIPPPGMYVLSIFIIGAVALSYWLFARLERDGILDGPRKDIYKYVTDHPGEHLANIVKTVGLSSSSIRYHLAVLEGMDLIVTHKNGKYKRFYINKNGYSKYTNGNGYKHIMSALKNNTARNIVKFLLSHPRANQKKVSCALDIHPSTVTWHAKRLEEAEIISKQRKGKEIHYSLNSDVQLRKVIGIIEGSPAY